MDMAATAAESPRPAARGEADARSAAGEGSSGRTPSLIRLPLLEEPLCIQISKDCDKLVGWVFDDHERTPVANRAARLVRPGQLASSGTSGPRLTMRKTRASSRATWARKMGECVAQRICAPVDCYCRAFPFDRVSLGSPSRTPDRHSEEVSRQQLSRSGN